MEARRAETRLRGSVRLHDSPMARLRAGTPKPNAKPIKGTGAYPDAPPFHPMSGDFCRRSATGLRLWACVFPKTQRDKKKSAGADSGGFQHTLRGVVNTGGAP